MTKGPELLFTRVPDKKAGRCISDFFDEDGRLIRFASDEYMAQIPDLVFRDGPPVGYEWIDDSPRLWNKFISEDPSAIYFVMGDMSGLVKIGVARDLPSRLSQMRTGSGEPLSLLSWCPGTREYEKYLHKKFRSIRLRGEWHWPHEGLLRYALGCG